MEEPSVLDYLISKLTFWRKSSLEIPALAEEERAEVDAEGFSEQESKKTRFSFQGNWLVLAPLGLALLAQLALEPPSRSWRAGLGLYVLAVGSLIWLLVRGSWKPVPLPLDRELDLSLAFRDNVFLIATGLSVAAFFLFRNNRFNPLNLTLWVLSIGLFFWSFWEGQNEGEKLRQAWRRFWKEGLRISPWGLLVLAVLGLAFFYRFYQLREVPPEMFSDHAEKLIDVSDVLAGKTSIFFPRNTGREAFQMYLTAAVSRVFKTGLSFLSLKMGTALAGFLTLPFIYLLGKEVGNKRVGVFAVFLAGIAYWPNVISRVALRFTLYPFFAAPTLFFLVRGLRRQRRNDFLWAGLFLGLGLHGYSTFRIVPLVVLVGFVVYFLHQSRRGNWKDILLALGLVVLISLIIFLPLMRYALENYQSFSYRMMTRLSNAERELPGPAWKIFLQNMGRVLVMFQWDNGRIWVHSIPRRPALGVVSAALFTLGVVLLIARYVRERNWVDLFLLISIPLLLLSSALSLAFPDENPSLNRTGGALIPVFVIAAIALEGLARSLKSGFQSRWAQKSVWVLVIVLLAFSSYQNYNLVFHTYHDQFEQSAWNTSELGAVIRQFADTVGAEDQAWVVPYPYWVDTRLVGLRAGVPLKDYALWRDEIPTTTDIAGAKMYLFKPEDQETADMLREQYPQGVLSRYESDVPGKDFMIFFVPSHETEDPL
jgi:NADH:ubiquinone oxidoreductase subunit 6 (subunit J)